MRNCGGGEDAGSDADGSFASCVSEPTSPTWPPSHALSPLKRKFDRGKKGGEGGVAVAIAAASSAQCVSASPQSAARGPGGHLPARQHGPSPGKSVPEIRHQQRSSLPLVDFLARFRPCPPPPQPQPAAAMKGSLPRPGHGRRRPTESSSSSSSSAVNNLSPLLLSLRRLQTGGHDDVGNGEDGKEDDDGVEEDDEEEYEMEEQDATPSTPLLLKGRKLNNPMQSKHRDSPPPSSSPPWTSHPWSLTLPGYLVLGSLAFP